MTTRQKDATNDSEVGISATVEAPRPSVLFTTASYIIATEFCERLAYYGFAGSLVLFFETNLDMSSADAVNSFSLWSGAVYVTPLLGGYVADAWLGRYKTILFFCIFYLMGLAVFLAGASPDTAAKSQTALVFAGMYIVALGAGGIKPNCSTMGADQFDVNHEQDRREAKQFFSYFYWSINLGALVAYTLVAYICQYGLPTLGGKDWGFFVGYSIPSIALGLGVCLFMSGSKLYRKCPPGGSMVSVVASLIYQALFPPNSEEVSESLLVNHTANSAQEKVANENSKSLFVLPPHWLDKASYQRGGNFSPAQVESVKYVIKLVPFLCVMIPYWGIYSQTKTAFQLQSCQMDVNMGSFQLPVSAMNIFNNIAILCLVPLFDQVLYPYLRSKNMELSMLRKIGLGFICAMAAMVFAALLELYRQSETPTAGGYNDAAAKANMSPCRSIDNFNPYQYQEWAAGEDVSKPLNCWQIAGCDQMDNGMLSLSCIQCDNLPQMSRVSIFWQIPGFVLIGVSEIFASITSLEFFYSQAPSNMRSVSQSFNLLTSALGSWLTIPLTLLVNINPNNEWVSSNIDEGHLDWYFTLLAALMAVALAVFWWLSSGYQYADAAILEELANITSERSDGEEKVRAMSDEASTHHRLMSTEVDA